MSSKITHVHIWGDFQYYKGRKCNFRESIKIIGCCIYIIVADWEVAMAQFKCKLSSNIGQDFFNLFMSLSSETRKRRQSKFSASTSLTETNSMYIYPLTITSRNDII